MTQNDDPTDNALAAIASILDKKDLASAQGGERGVDRSVESSEVVTDKTALEAAVADIVGSETVVSEPVVSETVVSEMVISERTTITIVSETPLDETEQTVAAHDAPATVPEPVDVDGYSRLGPGPLDAIRFCWTARRDEEGRYFVDETIGSSRPISTGPMPAEAVVAFINDRERSARDRFDTLKNRMTVGSGVAIDHD